MIKTSVSDAILIGKPTSKTQYWYKQTIINIIHFLIIIVYRKWTCKTKSKINSSIIKIIP